LLGGGGLSHGLQCLIVPTAHSRSCALSRMRANGPLHLLPRPPRQEREFSKVTSIVICHGKLRSELTLRVSTCVRMRRRQHRGGGRCVVNSTMPRVTTANRFTTARTRIHKVRANSFFEGGGGVRCQTSWGVCICMYVYVCIYDMR